MLSLQLLNVLLVVSTAGLQAPAAAPTFASTIDQWWGMIETSFVTAAEAMPADKYDFAPTGAGFEGVRTFGGQVKHVACANYAFFNQVEMKTPPASCETGGPNPAKTKEELLSYLKESFDYAQGVLTRLTPANGSTPSTDATAGRRPGSGSRHSPCGTPPTITDKSCSTFG